MIRNKVFVIVAIAIIIIFFGFMFGMDEKHLGEKVIIGNDTLLITSIEDNGYSSQYVLSNGAKLDMQWYNTLKGKTEGIVKITK